MVKYIPSAKGLKNLALALCAAGVLAAPAQAQSNGIAEQGMTSSQAAAPVSDRGLPSITRNNNDPRNPRLSEQLPNSRTRVLNPSALQQDTFGKYVEDVTGARLKLFGQSLFTDVPTTFSPASGVQVNGDYVVGSGDEIQVRGWGMINVDVTATVDKNGAVYIPQVGAVKVAGVKYRDLQAYLKQAISKVFSNFELTASISQSRSLQIYVVGHAVRPGTYTLNAMSTMLNALFTSGGPDATGSMRNIQLKRGGETVTTFDLYDMLVSGSKAKDASLRDGDVIFIPQVGPLVALTGNVKTPAIFELKGATSVADVLGWAGGVDSAADQKRVVIEKTVDNVYKTVADLNAEQSMLNLQLGAIPVQPTDVLRVFAPSSVGVQAQLQHEYVQVAGEVSKTGVFEIQKGETLRDLMIRLGGVSDRGYLFATQLKRDSVRRSQQLKLDEIADRFEKEVESAASARVAGTTDKEAVALQAAEVERQRKTAERLRTVKAEGRIVLELASADAELKNLPDLPLQDGDSIFVPRRPGTVEVLGSVFQSNSFLYRPNRNVKDYVLLAGGGTASADNSEMYVIRADGTARSARGSGWFAGVGGVQVNPGDTIVVPEKIDRSSLRQSLKEWTAIFYQFGLGAAGLKVLRD